MGLEVVTSAGTDSSHLWNCMPRSSGIGKSHEGLESQILRNICFPCSTVGEASPRGS